MKNLLFFAILFFGLMLINPQETHSIQNSNTTTQHIASKKEESSQLSLSEPIKRLTTTDAKKVCYAETSKVAFYEVLIANNGFKIDLKDSKEAYRNTEEIIYKNREEVLYSEKDE